MIVAGGGVIYAEATAALADFAESLGVPVVETQAGKGALPWDHPWNAGPVGSNGGLAANRLAREADLVLAIGTRLSDFTSASHTAFQHPEVRFVGLNIAALDAYKFGALPLVGDAREGLCALLHGLRKAGYRTDNAYAERVRGLKEEWNATVDEQRRVEDGTRLTQANVIGIVNEVSGPRDVVVCAAGGMPGDLLKLWRPQDPKGYHVEYGYSCMGYEIAGGLGVKLAAPDREVFVMVGDGSYLMMHTEIVTSLEEGKKLTIVVVDNNGYQCIRGLQMASGSPHFGNELRYRDPSSNRLEGPFVPIDFAKNAESLGAVAFSADDEATFREVLAKAIASDRTAVVHVLVDTEARVPGFESWWDVPIAQASNEPGVKEAHASYEEAKRKQRVLV